MRMCPDQVGRRVPVHRRQKVIVRPDERTGNVFTFLNRSPMLFLWTRSIEMQSRKWNFSFLVA